MNDEVAQVSLLACKLYETFGIRPSEVFLKHNDTPFSFLQGKRGRMFKRPAAKSE